MKIHAEMGGHLAQIHGLFITGIQKRGLLFARDKTKYTCLGTIAHPREFQAKVT